jgi:hypothetical protein
MTRTTTLTICIAVAGCRPDGVDARKSAPSEQQPASAPTRLAEPIAVAPADAGDDTLTPIVTRCAADVDCVAVGFEVEGPLTCCASCRTTAVNKTWASLARGFCVPSRMATRPCPPLACPMGLQTTHCERETCVLGLR